MIQIQRRLKKRWIADDSNGGIRYLMGVVRDAIGNYLCFTDDLHKIGLIKACLSSSYEELLLPECDDWQAIE